MRQGEVGVQVETLADGCLIAPLGATRKYRILPAAFYRTAAGSEPVRTWQKSLSLKERRLIGKDIAAVELGWPLGMPHSRSITSRRGLWEVRSSLNGIRVEGLYEEATSVAWKRVLAWQVAEAMKEAGISKSEMAKRMRKSRSQLERRLDPDNPSVLLKTVQKAASALGKRITIGLEDVPRPGA